MKPSQMSTIEVHYNLFEGIAVDLVKCKEFKILASWMKNLCQVGSYVFPFFQIPVHIGFRVLNNMTNDFQFLYAKMCIYDGASWHTRRVVSTPFKRVILLHRASFQHPSEANKTDNGSNFDVSLRTRTLNLPS